MRKTLPEKIMFAITIAVVTIVLLAMANAQYPGYYFDKALGKQVPLLRTIQEPPPVFQYNQSTLQSFYFVQYTTNFEPMQGEDWFGAFNGEICVGSRIWSGDWSDVPVMGDDGSDYNDGYCNAGDYPTFQFYDASEDLLYELNAVGEICPFVSNGFCTVSFELGDLLSPEPDPPDTEGFLYPLLYNADGEPVWFLKLFTQ